jgi:alanine racemase
MTVHDAPLRPEKIAPTAQKEADAGGILTIDLSAIEANWRTLARMATPVDCAAVVKADAYGCGLDEVTARLSKAGCKTFFVADLGEARRVRAIAPEAVIYVLNGLLPGTGPSFAEAYLRPVINSTTELAEWDRFVSSNNWRGGAALHVDTGMNRLGMTPDEVVAMAPRIQSENHGITLLMSHLACAETPEHPLNEKQIRLFRDIRSHYRGMPTSLANSSGIFLGSNAHGDLVRPGIALYGGNPTPARKNPMRPVVELKARIIQTRVVQRGDTVGYAAAWTAPRQSRLAMVAVGYGDGYARAAGANKSKPSAPVLVAGKPCAIVGRISMDIMAVDVTDLAENQGRRGDLVTLIGGDLDVDALGTAIGTIGYEVLTSLGRRYHRIYKSG